MISFINEAFIHGLLLIIGLGFILLNPDETSPKYIFAFPQFPHFKLCIFAFPCFHSLHSHLSMFFYFVFSHFGVLFPLILCFHIYRYNLEIANNYNSTNFRQSKPYPSAIVFNRQRPDAGPSLETSKFALVFFR